MKAMVLAAGRGERMRPLTDDCPKPLLKVGGKCLIEYHLESLAKAGIKEVVINYAWLGHLFAETLGDGERYGLRIHYSDEGDTALETAGGIINALDKLGEDPFLVINGDIWTDYDYQNLINKSEAVMHLVLVPNPAHHPHGDFALSEDGLVLDQKSFTFSGIGLYSPEIFTSIKGEQRIQPLAPIIRRYIAEQKVTGELYKGKWLDIGTPERLAELDNSLS